MSERLAKKVCVITGAGSGIGRASALLFAREGGCVVVADVDEAGADDTVRQIKSEGGAASSFVVALAITSAFFLWLCRPRMRPRLPDGWISTSCPSRSSP